MSSARRIVIDTGVLVSAALRPDSVPALALEKALLDYDACVSPATLEELRAVLSRSKFDAYLPMALRMDFIEGYRERAFAFEVTETVGDCVDPKDNKFLALAAVADAELIVASDPHLTAMHPWRGIAIMPSAAFLVGRF
jgi:putative PIN family toxin of toxin-antitoxin system